MTQLATKIEPTAPLKSDPQRADLCPVRDLCIVPTRIKERGGREVVIEMSRAKMGISCGFEIVGTVAACPKRQRLEAYP